MSDQLFPLPQTHSGEIMGRLITHGPSRTHCWDDGPDAQRSAFPSPQDPDTRRGNIDAGVECGGCKHSCVGCGMLIAEEGGGVVGGGGGTSWAFGISARRPGAVVQGTSGNETVFEAKSVQGFVCFDAEPRSFDAVPGSAQTVCLQQIKSKKNDKPAVATKQRGVCGGGRGMREGDDGINKCLRITDNKGGSFCSHLQFIQKVNIPR